MASSASSTSSLRRLEQTLGHFKPQSSTKHRKLSIVHGHKDQALWEVGLGGLLEEQAIKFPTREAIVCPALGQGPEHRFTYEGLNQRSKELARSLLALGVQKGDRIGIFAGNGIEYVTLIFAAGRIGAILVVLNTKWNPEEVRNSLNVTGTKVFFTAKHIGSADHTPILDMLRRCSQTKEIPTLENVILIGRTSNEFHAGAQSFEALIGQGNTVSADTLQDVERDVSHLDVCNLQFTSGTTGSPKAAQLTHSNIINNGMFIGDRMALTEKDVVCCPPPLFHCFGIVLGLMACITHGSTIVFPGEAFDARMTLEAVHREKCTALHGVPTMFAAELAERRRAGYKISHLRTGIAAGAPVPRQLMEDLRAEFDLQELTNTYGMTETSPASFMTFTTDPVEKRLSTVGTILPHTSAMVIDANGQVVPRGVRGELCVAGYLLQKGYWQNPEKTAEVMIRDRDGVLWMHTGDEVTFDDEGYCRITGRIKDIIIRGGENIYPLEIEDRLVQHPSIAQASVVGLKNERYGETVCAFLKQKTSTARPNLSDLQSWTREVLARYKAPQHVFWTGVDGVGAEFPQTASGKIQKTVLKDLGDVLAANGLGKR